VEGEEEEEEAAVGPCSWLPLRQEMRGAEVVGVVAVRSASAQQQPQQTQVGVVAVRSSLAQQQPQQTQEGVGVQGVATP
jgi:hypothetical protein